MLYRASKHLHSKIFINAYSQTLKTSFDKKGCEIMNVNKIFGNVAEILNVSQVEPYVIEKANPENGEVDSIPVMQPSLGGSAYSLYPWYAY